MAADYTVKMDAIPGPLVVDINFLDGGTPDLTMPAGTTAQLRMRRAGFGGATTWTKDMVITGPKTVSYDWQDGDLDLPAGAYEAEVLVAYLSGKRAIFPADPERPYLVIDIEQSIAPEVP